MLNIFAVMHRLMSSRTVTIQIGGVSVSEILAAAKSEERDTLRQAQEVLYNDDIVMQRSLCAYVDSCNCDSPPQGAHWEKSSLKSLQKNVRTFGQN